MTTPESPNPKPSPPARRRLLWAIPILFVLLLTTLALLRPGSAQPPSPTAQKPVVPILTLQRDSHYQIDQRFLGRVEARRSSQLGFELPGTVQSVAVEEGVAVRQGDVLATLDAARLRARQNELQAALHEAEAAETLTQANYDRTAQLVRDRVATQAELDVALKERDESAATVRRIHAQLESVAVDLAESELIAPYDGTIARRMADEGAVVAEGQPILELVESGQPELRIALTPAAARQLTIGETFEVRHEEGDDLLQAELLRKLPTRDQDTRTIDAIFSVRSESLFPGDLVELRLTREVAADGFWLSVEALTESRRGLWACFVLAPDADGADRLERRQLEILHESGDRAYVRGALSEGDRVAIRGLQKLTPGLAVQAAEPNSPQS